MEHQTSNSAANAAIITTLSVDDSNLEYLSIHFSSIFNNIPRKYYYGTHLDYIDLINQGGCKPLNPQFDKIYQDIRLKYPQFFLGEYYDYVKGIFNPALKIAYKLNILLKRELSSKISQDFITPFCRGQYEISKLYLFRHLTKESETAKKQFDKTIDVCEKCNYIYLTDKFVFFCKKPAKQLNPLVYKDCVIQLKPSCRKETITVYNTFPMEKLELVENPAENIDKYLNKWKEIDNKTCCDGIKFKNVITSLFKEENSPQIIHINDLYEEYNAAFDTGNFHKFNECIKSLKENCKITFDGGWQILEGKINNLTARLNYVVNFIKQFDKEDHLNKLFVKYKNEFRKTDKIKILNNHFDYADCYSLFIIDFCLDYIEYKNLSTVVRSVRNNIQAVFDLAEFGPWLHFGDTCIFTNKKHMSPLAKNIQRSFQNLQKIKSIDISISSKLILNENYISVEDSNGFVTWGVYNNIIRNEWEKNLGAKLLKTYLKKRKISNKVNLIHIPVITGISLHPSVDENLRVSCDIKINSFGGKKINTLSVAEEHNLMIKINNSKQIKETKLNFVSQIDEIIKPLKKYKNRKKIVKIIKDSL